MDEPSGGGSRIEPDQLQEIRDLLLRFAANLRRQAVLAKRSQEIQEEIAELSRKSNRGHYVTVSLVVIVGMLLGAWLLFRGGLLWI